MLRCESKAEKDAIIATGLLPDSFAIDTLATLLWPFNGLPEIDAHSRCKDKSLCHKTPHFDLGEDRLTLSFTPSARPPPLGEYLAARCHEREPKLFPYIAATPTEIGFLEAVEWLPSQTGLEKNCRTRHGKRAK
ncbi:hypothetical protein D0864_12415 [Hortaea werneckii]|nr:hypothetical protein D0864_12415 [Hortaea werneckii]